MQEADRYLLYEAKSGDIFPFDTSREACEPWGFFSGSRVSTPKGSATVIGVYDKYLWFHIDGDKGASFWDNCKSYEDLLGLGVSVEEAPIQVIEPVTKGGYRIKRIDVKDKKVSIIQQNENGPCPLIAIANILAIQGYISIEGRDNRVSVESVVSQISDYVRSQHSSKTDEEKASVEEVLKSLSDLQYGLDVNFTFVDCESFEASTKSRIFGLLGIRMVHGWLVEPNSKVASIIGNLTYNDVTLRLVESQETNEQKNEEKADESKENYRKFTPEEGVLVHQFLESTASQLTEYGLIQLHQTIKEGELAVFFRNNHFSTLTKYDGKLFNLVTDIGYERERLVVWDLLESVDGNSCFYSSEFRGANDEKNEEVINTALLCGFARDKVDEAIKAVSKPNEELKIDDVLAWLSKNAPLN